MTEQWLPVPSYAGWYEVSDQGRVRSVNRTVDHKLGPKRVKGRVLVARPTRSGYPMVSLKRNGVRKDCTVHSLVLLAFVGPRPKGAVSRHLNCVRSDPRLENLRWGTQSENMFDRVRDGNDHNVNKTHCAHGHAYSGKNLRVTPTGRRECRACVRERSRQYKLRKMAVAS